MSTFKGEWRHDVFAPCHETLVFEVLVAAVQKPNLLAQRTWYRLLHSLSKNISFNTMNEQPFSSLQDLLVLQPR
jgi:hypothetical protein